MAWPKPAFQEQDGTQSPQETPGPKGSTLSKLQQQASPVGAQANDPLQLGGSSVHADISGTGNNSDIEDCFRMPIPLENELLEYLDSLPSDFVERVGSEFKARERRVAQLRAENAMLRGAISQGNCAQAEQWPAECAHADKASHKSALAECARQHEAEACRVEHAAENELLELARCSHGVEEQRRQLLREEAEDVAMQRRLWEVRAEVSRLRCRSQHLERLLRQTQQRASRQEQEDRQLAIDIDRLKSQTHGFRARMPDLDSLEQEEGELRQQLQRVQAALQTAGCGFGSRVDMPTDPSCGTSKTSSVQVKKTSISKIFDKSATCFLSSLMAVPTPARPGLDR